MSKTRFTPWVVLVCMSALAACTSGEGGTAGNTELNVIVPNNESSPGVPAPIDIQTVEYTINCLGNSDTFLDNSASFADEVTINGNLEVVDGRTDPQGSIPPEFGTPRPGDRAEIWQGFMDLPPGPCSVQLRARDNDGEVICTATEPFTITADTTAKVNLVLYCNVSYQAPVGMVDVDATFSFNVGNFCPDLFVLNCLDSNPVEQDIGIGIPVAVTQCEVRYRDGDSTCGQGCDPQTCSATPEGLTCVPGPDPGVSTTVTCTDLQIDCDGNPGTTETECTFAGDQLGTLPVSGPIVPNYAAFNVACIPPALGGIPGITGSCTAVTTDGDVDCDKTKIVEVNCPGLNFCDQVAPGDNLTDCSVDSASTCLIGSCDRTAQACVTDPVPAGGGANCNFAPGGGLGQCDGAGNCEDYGCSTDADCEQDGNDCTEPPVGACDTVTGLCAAEVNSPSGTLCDSGSGADTGTCDGAGTCVDPCSPNPCDDSNECTQNLCDNTGGAATCSYPDEPNGTSCASGTGQCSDTAPGSPPSQCVIPFDFPLSQVAIDMCCNNNALPQQSIIPIRLDVDPGSAVPGGAFTADLSGLLTFPESFLDVAQTVVVGGVQTADLIDAQVTALPRGTGATGSPVPVPPIFPPGQCLVDSSACDATLSNPDGSNPGCVPVGSFNPCQRLVTVPTTSSETECIQLDVDAGRIAGSTCTIGTDCTKQDQWNLNGFCVTGPLPIPLDTVVGNYTAGASTDQMLFGWSDDPAATGTTYTAPNWTVPAPVFTDPLLANGLKVNASGLSVAINCVMAVENGDPLTDPVTCGLTPDSALNGAAAGTPTGNQDYTIP